MLAYARTKDANATQNNYFQIVSTRRLGQTQDNQFMAMQDATKDWRWGSKCTADNVCSESNTVTTNALSEMPRSIVRYNEVYYNWHAATAESGTYAMATGNASDSVCPKGWQLPGSSKTLTTLFSNYGAGNNAQGSKLARTNPLNYVLTGRYISGHYNDTGTGGMLWFSDAAATTSAGSLGLYSSALIAPNSDQKMQGHAVRCVKK